MTRREAIKLAMLGVVATPAAVAAVHAAPKMRVIEIRRAHPVNISDLESWCVIKLPRCEYVTRWKLENGTMHLLSQTVEHVDSDKPPIRGIECRTLEIEQSSWPLPV